VEIIFCFVDFVDFHILHLSNYINNTPIPNTGESK